MFEMVDALKSGFDLWKKAWSTQIIVYLILLFVGVLIITPFVIFNVISASFAWNPVDADPIAFLLFQLVMSNPIFWLSIFLTCCVILILIAIIIAAIQKVAHNYAETGIRRFGELIKSLIPMILPLAVVAIVSGILFLITSLIYTEIIILLRSLFPLVEIPHFESTIKLTSLDILAIVFYPAIVILLSGPYFLAISAVVVDNAGINAIVNAWKLYFSKLRSMIVALVILFIVGLISGIMIFMPLTAIFVTSSNIGMILGIGFFLMVLRILMSPFIDNFVFTSLYSFYQEIKV